MSNGPPTDPAADAPPWERPGAVRRDALPHRGPLLWNLSCLATGTAVAGCLCAPVVAVGLVLALTVVALAARDLRAMERGAVDSRGRGLTRDALRVGLGSLALQALIASVWGYAVIAAFR